MTLRDIPVVLDGYRLMITEAPVMKMRTQRDDRGAIVTDVNGDEVQVPATAFGSDEPLYVVSLFAKKIPGPGGFKSKGEEIKVVLTSDPGPDFVEGMYVSLRGATMSLMKMAHKNAHKHADTKDAIGYADFSFQAKGLSPATAYPATQAA